MCRQGALLRSLLLYFADHNIISFLFVNVKHIWVLTFKFMEYAMFLAKGNGGKRKNYSLKR